MTGFEVACAFGPTASANGSAKTMSLYAHSLQGRPEREWEPLSEHAHAVAERAAGFADSFGAGSIARIAGLLHDQGKAKPGFQHYLRGGRQVPHSAEGALTAIKEFGPLLGRVLAFCIAGHHAGLANGSLEGGGTTPLDERLKQAEHLSLPPGIDLPQKPKDLPSPLRDGRLSDPFTVFFFVRMIFSALIDADRLATEEYYAKVEQRKFERGWHGKLETLREAFDRHVAQFNGRLGEVDVVRAEVLDGARKAARLSPGLFSLTVPTGGGKTLSSLAFALDHAIQHKKRRVIYVAPFTAVIEQTADVYRETLGDDEAILEHHSAFDFDALEDDEGRDAADALRRAAQNWDRPIIVTTAVQLFESLFAARPSRCRKLHSLAGSVIVLDEAQTLPLKVLRPCLAALRELARGYGASVVFCTATQPAIRRKDGFGAPEALEEVREIAPNPSNLFARLKRVKVEPPCTMSDEAVLEHMIAEPYALCIVNSRSHARLLFDALATRDVKGRHHLTTAMTAAHRRATLDDIRKHPGKERTCRVVATSLIEAGVDISFPFVMRAIAGLDQIAQAAGRCNRSNEWGREGGRVIVFHPEGHSPPPEFEQFVNAAASVMPNHADPLTIEAIQDYFGELYWRRGIEQLDALKIADGRYSGVLNAIRETAGGGKPAFAFASIAKGFRLIEATMLPVIVPASETMPYGASADLLRELESAKSLENIARRLQLFVVPVPRGSRTALIDAGAARVAREEEFGEQFVILENASLYHSERGLDWNDPSYRPAESLIG